MKNEELLEYHNQAIVYSNFQIFDSLNYFRVIQHFNLKIPFTVYKAFNLDPSHIVGTLELFTPPHMLHKLNARFSVRFNSLNTSLWQGRSCPFF